jgi:hypothetical protein
LPFIIVGFCISPLSPQQNFLKYQRKIIWLTVVLERTISLKSILEIKSDDGSAFLARVLASNPANILILIKLKICKWSVLRRFFNHIIIKVLHSANTEIRSVWWRYFFEMWPRNGQWTWPFLLYSFIFFCNFSLD